MDSPIQIQMVPVGRISPHSTVNVRRSDVDENRARMKASIQRNGFYGEHPILLRPHPDDTQDEYDYEPVSGRSRFLGAMDAGHAEVPCIVEDLEDDAAHQRSFAENEQRGQLSASDKAHWFELKYNSLRGPHTRRQARQMTAEFYGVSPQTVDNFLLMATVPEQVMQDVDRKILTQAHAQAIAKRYAHLDEEPQETAMIAAADWTKSLSNREKSYAGAAIRDATGEANLQDLQDALNHLMRKGNTDFSFQVPPDTATKLEEYALSRGYTDPNLVLPLIVTEAIRNAGLE